MDRELSWLKNTRKAKPNSAVSRPPWLLRAPRLMLIGWVILLVMGLYLIRLWQLQFLEGGYYQAKAEQQQTRLVTISPPRGVIFDRNGETLVRNIPAYNVIITPGYLPDDAERERAVLERLSQIIDVPYSTTTGPDAVPYQGELGTVGREKFPPYGEIPSPGLIEMVEEVRYLRPYAPLVVTTNIDREIALLVAQEGGVTLPGVGVQIVPRRSYVYSELTSQVLGFLGPIPPEQMETYEARGYDISVDRIGYAGIEANAEDYLRGVPGRRLIIEDVMGRELETINEISPNSGDNVHLTLDVELQEVGHAALQEMLDEAGSRRGAAVAIDPRNGKVLMLVSLPTYDNNMFSKRLNLEEYRAITQDPHQPLVNHAISDQIPPGSTFKVIPATAALQEGIVNRYTTVNCPGRILLPNKFAPDDPKAAQPFYCWIYLSSGGGHGNVNVVDALAQSCDVFFYEVGGGYEPTNFEGLGLELLADYAKQFGLGEITQIDIPGEGAGLVPDSRWKRLNYRESWTTGDTYNMSIGQGFLLATPLQMANVMAVVANQGTLFQPQLIDHITDADGNMVVPFESKILKQLEVDASVWQIVQEGVDLAVSESGTGRYSLVEGVNVAGKTGTAEYCDDMAYKAGLCDVEEHETLPTHAWFMAYAPVEAPEIAIAVWIYNGGEGSTMAAPAAQKVLDFYFKRASGQLDEENPDEEENPEAAEESHLPAEFNDPT
ncbi:MAG: penicillin-binding protein 2 [Anaerolineae bacterium]|nr:penicillin-binding protein 2 [Anaerolineae bacterium]